MGPRSPDEPGSGLSCAIRRPVWYMPKIAKELSDVAREAFADIKDTVESGDVPSQALCRRAVSTAYYAAFHYLVEKSIEIVAPSASSEVQVAIARTFKHGEMKDFARKIARGGLPKTIRDLFLHQSPGLERLKTLANSFEFLQEERHAADYDLSDEFDQNRVFQALKAMAMVMVVLGVRERDERSSETIDFLTLLPFAGRLR